MITLYQLEQRQGKVITLYQLEHTVQVNETLYQNPNHRGGNWMKI